MADDSYDEELAEAIRRSLADQSSTSQASNSHAEAAPTTATHIKIKKEEDEGTPIIVLDSDDDTEDNKKLVIKREEESDKAVKKEETTDEKPQLSSMLNLNRAQMERDRLARARLKRKTSDDSYLPLSKHIRTLATQSLIVKKEEPSDPSEIPSTSRRGPFMTLRDLQERVSSYIPRHSQYLDGVVKKTYVEGRDRTSDDITLEEVFQKDTLQTAVLSAYVWEFNWVLQKLNVGECDLVLVLHAKEDDMVDHYRRNMCNLPRTRLCFPNMSGNVNCMHSKLQLLFHLTYLRVVVPTANMTPYDWGEALGTGKSEGVMENSAFIIDFPELPKASIAGDSEPNPSHTHFSRRLLHFCKAKGLPADVLEKLDRAYDFSRSKHLGFVYSIGGSHHGTDALTNGVCGLATAVKTLRLNTKKPIQVDYVTSSLGSLNKEFLLRMFHAFQGDNGKKCVQGIPKKYSSRQLAAEPAAADESTESESEEEEQSDGKLWQAIQGSLRNGGTICFQRKWFMSSTFPQSILHDCQSARSGMLMHNKMIFVRFSLPRGKVLAWAYIGSANLSESAWGKLVWDRTQKEFKMSNRNWECGVIVPVPQPDGQEQEHDSADGGSTPDMGVFTDIIPVPMSIPSPLLTAANPPWYFGELRGNP
ncbi:hypothetical protein DRE_06268 [Drechslerella stenobrocha 248]|uniref:PLD phosphodiesterase domain-containing protein n=1 Tax=Drechslerella stenobrocha 248 TaxID=1043628 RepID=W7HPS3_9PEZI|nr:hypothetical protein DRE_06268 [Drechslerella stenobrocha 248]